MAYTALARRYRSQQFDEVVGQEAIARTLRSAIDSNRVAHAYLFTGTRGVGKTTMARLFAKAINAPGDQPPDVAKAIMEGRDTDVIEIDAASNRGVEEARELIANCIYRPMRGRFKVYIIDEVHMLTREAFNTLLKTMEEPPEHVKFILCTTETHKVPATIQSRCQRFDFRNIPTRRIAEHLKAVVEQEGVKAEAGALAAVARQAEGSMRDALSLLDRLMASGEKALTSALLEELLGLPDLELLDALLLSAADGDAKASLERADALLNKGVSADQMLEALLDRLRDVLVLSTCGQETELVESEGEERARAVALASRLDGALIVHMIALCENVQARLKYTSAPRALLDAMVARLSMTTRIADAATLAGGSGSAASEAPQKKTLHPPPLTERAPAPTPARAAAPPADPPSVEAPPPGVVTRPPTDDLAEIWRRVREAGAGAGATSVMLDTLGLVGVAGGTAHVHADSQQALSYAVQRAEKLNSMLSAAAGRPLRVAIALREGAQHAPPARGATPGPDPRLEAERVPIVKRAIDLFDARVVRVEDDPGQGGA